MNGKLVRFARLRPPLRAAWLRSWLELYRVAVGLRVVGVARVIRRVEKATRDRSVAADSPTPSEIAWCVRSAASHALLGRNCLRESIVEYGLLRRSDHSAQLRIGVAREEDGLAAHAWVESGPACEDPTAPVSTPAGEYLPFHRPLLPRGRAGR